MALPYESGVSMGMTRPRLKVRWRLMSIKQGKAAGFEAGLSVEMVISASKAAAYGGLTLGRYVVFDDGRFGFSYGIA